MKTDKPRQYTIRSVPPDVDRALRHRARNERKSLNGVALDALRRGAGLAESGPIHTDLDELVGSWAEDSAFDGAIRSQDVVDRRLWR